MSHDTLPLHKRLIERLMNRQARQAGDYTLPFLAEMLRTNSVSEVFRIFRDCQKVRDALTQRYGPRDANLLIGFAATWNGCRFCSRNHVWAANLYHLRDNGELFPLDDAEIPRLQTLPDEALLAELLRMLDAPSYARIRKLLERQFHLKRGDAVGTTPDDDHLRAAIAAWDWMVECTIVAEDVGDAPPDSLSSDRALVAQYLSLRGRPKK